MLKQSTMRQLLRLTWLNHESRLELLELLEVHLATRTRVRCVRCPFLSCLSCHAVFPVSDFGWQASSKRSLVSVVKEKSAQKLACRLDDERLVGKLHVHRLPHQHSTSPTIQKRLFWQSKKQFLAQGTNSRASLLIGSKAANLQLQ